MMFDMGCVRGGEINQILNHKIPSKPHHVPCILQEIHLKYFGENNFVIFVSKILPCPIEAEFPVTSLYVPLHFPLGRPSQISRDRVLPLELSLLFLMGVSLLTCVSLSEPRHHYYYNCLLAFISVMMRVSHAALLAPAVRNNSSFLHQLHFPYYSSFPTQMVNSDEVT